MQLVGARPGYDTAFYDLQRDESLRTAQAVVPVVRDLTQPTSVVDVGCGVGTWLAAWRECGVLDVHGIDGSYVDREMLLIPAEHFQPHDLSTPINVERRFELAMSLEV